MGEKANAAKGIDEPMKMQEVAYHTWPECYPVGDRRDIVRQIPAFNVYSSTRLYLE